MNIIKSVIINVINMLNSKMKFKRHEMKYGPHFNEECALKTVSKMENEDGTRGQRWSLEETTSIANQYGVNLKGEKFNKYDWYVALNMIRSDYYRAVVTMSNSDHIKHFVELAKAWLNDKDIDEGKMWYYYMYVMCDVMREDEEEEDDDDDDYEEIRHSRKARGRMTYSGRHMRGRNHMYGYEDEDDYYGYEERHQPAYKRISRY